ncbi:MAG: T9SS type A sorting domain-containing protein, partial [Owenweeksia sp.]
IYPNPVYQGSLNIEVSSQAFGDVQIRLIDSFGKTVRSLNSNSAGQIIFPVDGLARGTYTLQMIAKDEVYSHRVILMH